MKNRLRPEECISTGETYAASRPEIIAATGYCDSYVRSHIGKQRETEVILNLWNGRGYFKPTDADEEAVLKYFLREHAAAVTRIARTKTARKWLELHSNYTFEDYAPEIKVYALPADEKVFICRDGKMVEVTE